MTACIDPSGGQIKVHRDDPALRLLDYIDGLRFWLSIEDPRIRKIVFVENSGHSLDALRETASNFNPLGKQVEFISLSCNNYPDGTHYGYAELNMIDEVFARSEILKDCSYFIKATGRLMFPEITRLLDRVPQNYLFAVDSRNNSLFTRLPQVFVTTQLMLFSTSFYRLHLVGVKTGLSKSMALIENLLYQKLVTFKGKEGAILRWPVNVDPIGYAAHWHKKYDSPKQRTISFARSVCRVIFPSWWV